MSNRALAVVTAVVLLLSFSVGTYIYLSSRPSSSAGSSNGFDLSGGEKAGIAVEGAPAPAPPGKIQSSPHPLIGYGDDDAEEEGASAVVSGVPGGAHPSASADGVAAAIAAVPGAAAAAAGGSGGSTTPAAQRAHELDFLAKHGRELAAYHANLNKIAMKYFNSNPVVRDVDKAFAGMSNYMAVKKRYDKGGDPFQFARDAIALPEVRAEIAKRMTDPAVWGAALGMITEALKQPPPAALYKEAQNFMTADDKVADYVVGFTGDVAKNVPALIKGIPPGADLSGMKKIITDVAPSAALPP